MGQAQEWARAAPLAARLEAQALAWALVSAALAGWAPAELGPYLAAALEQVPGPVLAQALAELAPQAGAPARVLAKALEPERPVASVQELEQAGALVRALAEAQARALRAARARQAGLGLPAASRLAEAGPGEAEPAGCHPVERARE